MEKGTKKKIAIGVGLVAAAFLGFKLLGNKMTTAKLKALNWPAGFVNLIGEVQSDGTVTHGASPTTWIGKIVGNQLVWTNLKTAGKTEVWNIPAN